MTPGPREHEHGTAPARQDPRAAPHHDEQPRNDANHPGPSRPIPFVPMRERTSCPA